MTGAQKSPHERAFCGLDISAHPAAHFVVMPLPVANLVSVAWRGRGNAGSQCSQAGEGNNGGKDELLDLHGGSFSVMVLMDASQLTQPQSDFQECSTNGFAMNRAKVTPM